MVNSSFRGANRLPSVRRRSDRSRAWSNSRDTSNRSRRLRLVRISGYVKAVHADIGDRVKAGQALAELDVPELVEDLNQKAALVAQAKAEIAQAEKLLAVAERNVQSAAATVTEAMAARKRATANYDRWKSEDGPRRGPRRPQDHRRTDPRRDAQSVPLGRGDARRSRGEGPSAEAAQVESEAKRDKSQADVAVAKSKASVAAADEGRVRAMVGYAKIVAPFDGTVTFRNVDVGHFLQPGKDAPLFVVTMSSKVRVFVDVPEADAAAITDDAKAIVRVQAARPGVSGHGHAHGLALDGKSHTLRTEIDLPNADGMLRPGMYA